jgi:hypothetical protein
MVPTELLPPAMLFTYQVWLPPGLGERENWAVAEGATAAPPVMAKCLSMVTLTLPDEAAKLEFPEYFAVTV